jgi:hypothetical protein
MERKTTSPRFTPAVLKMFKRMVVLHQQCQCGLKGCAVCEELHDLDGKLFDELITTPWGGFPTLVWPGFQEPLRSQGTVGAEWRQDEGPELYRALCEAAGIAA